jgi:hypothetical protein
MWSCSVIVNASLAELAPDSAQRAAGIFERWFALGGHRRDLLPDQAASLKKIMRSCFVIVVRPSQEWRLVGFNEAEFLASLLCAE